MRQNGLKALLALLSAWFSSGAQASELAELAWQMVNEGALLIDVRTVEEYAQGHLDTALNWPLSEVETAFSAIEKERPIVLYCRSGNRSGIAQKYLIEQGYTRVHNGGGYAEMRQAANK
ncbi:rhodanese-like domain-containing protein [Vibrio cholerae]|uniref:rhodanese-like domain-containing protein n=1 Tax=Vibrio cholerae TaxID=666 RepID=UPI000893448A|nr:rhodanese-like domain-containing protein [Vibrio cholerae]EIJ2220253.1 rhodanese-like domain-containing protein [Vibrio cholerae]EJL6998307.1 rhodanese-like domain-containing protein [Vibrio cholerae]EKF9881889.1 rhodanese-like domain-containing protein [Vibrio cholerae]OFI74447.1 sulfurtransferase [Vibrio cholerae]OFI75217.1 sulfurtransferase [Vibrio cholerae]